MVIVRSADYYQWQMFNSEVAKSLGLEKACIIYNVERVKNSPNKSLAEVFPYIEQKRLQKLIKELVKEGYLVQGKNGLEASNE